MYLLVLEKVFPYFFFCVYYFVTVPRYYNRQYTNPKYFSSIYIHLWFLSSCIGSAQPYLNNIEQTCIWTLMPTMMEGCLSRSKFNWFPPTRQVANLNQRHQISRTSFCPSFRSVYWVTQIGSWPSRNTISSSNANEGISLSRIDQGGRSGLLSWTMSEPAQHIHYNTYKTSIICVVVVDWDNRSNIFLTLVSPKGVILIILIFTINNISI